MEDLVWCVGVLVEGEKVFCLLSQCPREVAVCQYEPLRAVWGMWGTLIGGRQGMVGVFYGVVDVVADGLTVGHPLGFRGVVMSHGGCGSGVVGALCTVCECA